MVTKKWRFYHFVKKDPKYSIIKRINDTNIYIYGWIYTKGLLLLPLLIMIIPSFIENYPNKSGFFKFYYSVGQILLNFRFYIFNYLTEVSVGTSIIYHAKLIIYLRFVFCWIILIFYEESFI